LRTSIQFSKVPLIAHALAKSIGKPRHWPEFAAAGPQPGMPKSLTSTEASAR
jgi:hypothetical protein